MNHLSYLKPLENDNCHYFTKVNEVFKYIPKYRRQLALTAQNYQNSGKVICDQDYPIELICFRPSQPTMNPLILMGGMGPLAGIDGFEKACQFFGNSREIILLQACSVPSRTAVMAEKQALGSTESSPLERKLVETIEQLICLAVSQIKSHRSPISIIFLCNAVHYFLPQVEQRLARNYPLIAQKIKWISLIQSVVKNLVDNNLQRPLLLCTTATRQGKTYSNYLKNKNINLLEPNDSLQSLLMDCIYQGVKACDYDYCCQFGEQFFVELLQNQLKNQPNADCIIAGCTEIPCLIQWLQTKANCNQVVTNFLKDIPIVNPVQLALDNSIDESILPIIF